MSNFAHSSDSRASLADHNITETNNYKEKLHIRFMPDELGPARCGINSLSSCASNAYDDDGVGGRRITRIIIVVIIIIIMYGTY